MKCSVPAASAGQRSAGEGREYPTQADAETECESTDSARYWPWPCQHGSRAVNAPVRVLHSLNIKVAHCSEMFSLTLGVVKALRVQCGTNVFSVMLPCYNSKYGYERRR